MKSIVIGFGEIGKALDDVLSSYCSIIITEDGIHRGCVDSKEVDIMNICLSYSKNFIEIVKKYQDEYSPKYTIVHSTVPIGTSRKLNAIHSPVIGIHPHLEQSLKTFTKFLGGEEASEVADYFRRAGVKVYLFDKQETTELMKIMDTTQYGLEIEYTKEIKRQCDKYGVPFEAWSIWIDNYNEGYKKLGYPEYCKPKLIPIMKKQGGHCVLQNCELLDNVFTNFLKELNENNSKTV